MQGGLNIACTTLSANSNANVIVAIHISELCCFCYKICKVNYALFRQHCTEINVSQKNLQVSRNILGLGSSIQMMGGQVASKTYADMGAATQIQSQ